MNFNQALDYIYQEIHKQSPNNEIDNIMLRAMFEDIVMERASEYFQDVGEEVISDQSDRATVENILQSKISNYEQFLQDSATAFIQEYNQDTEE